MLITQRCNWRETQHTEIITGLFGTTPRHDGKGEGRTSKLDLRCRACSTPHDGTAAEPLPVEREEFDGGSGTAWLPDGSAQPLTAPDVMPATIWRLKKMYITSGGMVMSSTSMKSRFQDDTDCEEKL